MKIDHVGWALARPLAAPAFPRAGRSFSQTFFGALEEGRPVLRAVYALDREGTYGVLEWPVDGEEYPPLSEIEPAAFLEECEIYEQFGVRPHGGKPLNWVIVPPLAHQSFPRLGSPPTHVPREVHARFFVAGEAFEFPFGPVRAVGQESLYMGLVTSGEEVIDLYLLQWHKHRGIERRLQGLDTTPALFFVERAEGLSAIGNSWAFCQAAESIAGATVSAEVERTRAVALELERLYNHAAALAAIAQSTGLSVGQAQAEIALEQFLRVNLAVAGHRYLFGLLAIGGVNRPLDTAALRKQLPAALGEFHRVADALMTTNSFLDRLEACGSSPLRRPGASGWSGRSPGRRVKVSTAVGTIGSGHTASWGSTSRYVTAATCFSPRTGHARGGREWRGYISDLVERGPRIRGGRDGLKSGAWCGARLVRGRPR